MLADEKDRNRALDGDLVAVEIKGKDTARIVAVVERRHRTRVAGLLKSLEASPHFVTRSIPRTMNKRTVRVFNPFDSR